MSNNLETDRSVTTGKMYPIDLAPQKITIVKSVSNTEMKMTHLITSQPKTSVSNQILGHASSGTGLMRPSIAQIISPNVASQPQMIVSGSPILQGTQIVSQGSQLLSQNSQMISQSQLITPSGQIISPATQIISQGTQLSVPVSSTNNTVNIQPSVASAVSGTQVLSVGGQFVSGSGNLVVNSSVRTLPPTVRVLPPLPHHNTTRPAVQLSSVNVSSASGVLVSKSVGVGVTSHVPRGLAAGASLAVRPVTPTANQPIGTQGSWSSSNRGSRGAVVYGSRGISRTGPSVSAPPVTPLTPTPVLTLPTTSVLSSTGVISTTVRGLTPRTPTPTPAPAAPRPLPLLQRNYQPAKVVGVASVGVRGVVGNSAPAQLYYEVPRPSPPTVTLAPHPVHAHAHTAGPNAAGNVSAPNGGNTALAHALAPQAHRPLTPYVHPHTHQTSPAQLSIVNAGTVLPETRRSPVSISTTSVLPRPSILRKRDLDGSPTKSPGANVSMGTTVSNLGITVAGGMSLSTGMNAGLSGTVFVVGEGIGTTGWEDVPAGEGGSGSTTVSASSSPAPDTEPDPPPPLQQDVSPRKKPRKQILSSEVRQCEYLPEDPPPSPPPVNIKTPKRPLLSSSYSCGWRSTALHFVRPSDVRVREPRARDILAIASQKHVLTSAEGWKVHHLTAQMDDLMSLETDVGEQLSTLLRALENASPRALHSLQPQEHTILELLKGNIQRSKIVCESVQEAREDILRVFTHRKFVSDILTRQADKRCFRKHRSQS